MERKKRQPNRWVSFLSKWSKYHHFPYGAMLNKTVLPYVKEDYKDDIMGDYSKLGIDIQRRKKIKGNRLITEYMK